MAILKGFPPSNLVGGGSYYSPSIKARTFVQPVQKKRFNYWVQRRLDRNPSICTRCSNSFLPHQVTKSEKWVCPLTNIAHWGQFCAKCDEERNAHKK